MESAENAKPTTRDILRMALYYGVAGFGGGYSILAQLRRDVVEKRRWLTQSEFFVLAELSKSLPGTAATSLIALLGQRVGGARKGAIAAAAFLIPSMILMIACGAAYDAMRALTHLSIFFDGMNAAMIGVVGAVTLDLGKGGLHTKRAVFAAVLCGLALTFRVVSEPVLALAAIAYGAARGIREMSIDPNSPGGEPSFLAGAFAGVVAATGKLASLVRVFVPIGIVTFGGGLAMIPAIEHTVVIEQHWLDAKAFADAVALGQITPGPIAICATFIGFRVAGTLGAVVATIAMFGPAIAVSLVAGRYVDRFGKNPIVKGALEALAPAVIGMLGAATVSLARASLVGPVEGVLAVATFVLLIKASLSPLWPLLAAGAVRVAWFFIAKK
ncbi:MAG: chromate efflux transporter [Polyangiaceae bacterium]